jgi:hypothetical protein
VSLECKPVWWSRVVHASSRARWTLGVGRHLSWPVGSWLGRVSWSWSASAVHHVGGEISPTLILVHAFIQKKNKVETSMDSVDFESLGVYILFKWINIYFYLYSFYFIYCWFILFFHGKLGLMGNLARWRHDMRMHELCGILTWQNLPIIERKCKALPWD